MSTWRMGLLSAALWCGFLGVALAQVGGVSGGLNSDSGAMSGGTINRVNGINANGTPRQQDPGASMTNGAGNSAMTPGVTGAPLIAGSLAAVECTLGAIYEGGDHELVTGHVVTMEIGEGSPLLFYRSGFGRFVA